MPRNSFKVSSPRRSTTYTQSPVKSRPSSLVEQIPPKGGLLREIGSVMAQGMAFGAGSEIAHQAVRGIMETNNHQPATVSQPQSNQGNGLSQYCSFENTEFIDCLKMNNGSIGTCQSLFDQLKICQKKMAQQ